MIEIATILVLGFLAQWLAWLIKMPSVLPLIIIGLVVGPLSIFYMPGGEKLIDGDRLFQEELLFDVVGISVGLILFEGGLTLKLGEVKNLATTVVLIIIVGALITLLFNAFSTYMIMGLNFETALLFSSLIVVTGPTVINPILRNVQPSKNIFTILKWEGILIDPFGAILAVLIYKYLTNYSDYTNFAGFFFTHIGLDILIGLLVGCSFGFILWFILKKNWIPDYLCNTVLLGFIVLNYATADTIREESGLISVTLLGMILANTKLERLNSILNFKQDITIILISVLFILLSSRINIEDLSILLDIKVVLLFIAITFIVRPLSVFISTSFSKISFKEKLFISFISPRGIVAVGVASIFALDLEKNSLIILI